MTGGATLVGLDELRSQLRAVDASLPRRIVPQALRRAAERRALPLARATAPRGATGRLARSVRVLASQQRVALKAGRSGVSYARFVHDGTRHMEGNPFLDRAVAATRADVSRIAEQELAAGMRRLGLDVT